MGKTYISILTLLLVGSHLLAGQPAAGLGQNPDTMPTSAAVAAADYLTLTPTPTPPFTPTPFPPPPPFVIPTPGTSPAPEPPRTYVPPEPVPRSKTYPWLPTPVPGPRLSLFTLPANLLPGYKGEISGYDFSPNDRVLITVNGAAVETVPPDFIPTDDRGRFRAGFWTPGIPGRIAEPIVSVEARDSQGQAASLTFPDDHRAVLITPMYAPYEWLDIRGVNFAAGARVRIYWENHELATDPKEIRVSAFGGEPWSARLTVPSRNPGRYEIIARDESGRKAFGIFDVHPDIVERVQTPYPGLPRPAFVKGDYFGVQLRGGPRDKLEGIRIVLMDEEQNRVVADAVTDRHGIAILPTPPSATTRSGERQKRYEVLVRDDTRHARFAPYPSHVISLGSGDSGARPPDVAKGSTQTKKEVPPDDERDTSFIGRLKEAFFKLIEWFNRRT